MGRPQEPFGEADARQAIRSLEIVAGPCERLLAAST
jgi:hypothetical protein